MKPPLAGAAVTDQRALVRAGVDERAQCSFTITHDDDRGVADGDGEIAMFFGCLAIHSQEHPAAFEDVADFPLEQGLVGKCSAVDAEPAI